MKDFIKISSIAVICLSSIALADDHGNSTSSATRVNASSTTSGSIERARDYDYFRIDVPSAGTLTVNSTGSLDTYGYLLNSSGSTITRNDDSGSGTNFRMLRAVTAGTYYIKVRAYSSRGTGSYRFVSSFASSGGGSSNSDDHGNSISSATRVNSSSTTSGSIERARDYDYFRIDIPSSGTLTVNSTGSLDTYGYLLNSSGSTITRNDDSGSGTNFRMLRAVTAGTYYIKVRAYSSSRTGNYQFISSFASSGGGGSSSSDDHGNSTSSATRVNTSSTTTGSIERGGDYDYFRIDIPSSGTLTVNSTGSFDTYGYLLNSSGATIERDDDDGSSTNFRISRPVTQGTYYVKVRGYSSRRTGSYSFVSFFRGNSSNQTPNRSEIYTEYGGHLSTFSQISNLLNGRTIAEDSRDRDIIAHANLNGIKETSGVISHIYDSTWGDNLGFSNSFNTVYDADVGLNSEGVFEVISVTDESGTLRGTDNRNAYYFSYDGLNPNRTTGDTGNAITIRQWINYLEQISERYGRIGKLSIFVHGNSGLLHMSDSFVLDTRTVTSNAYVRNQLRRLQNILTNNADILLFSCNVASSTITFRDRSTRTIPNNGINFIQRLANLTGARVHANTNSTGDSSWFSDSDWTLDEDRSPE